MRILKRNFFLLPFFFIPPEKLLSGKRKWDRDLEKLIRWGKIKLEKFLKNLTCQEISGIESLPWGYKFKKK